MKRNLIYVLIIGLLLTLASCTGETPSTPDNSGNTSNTPVYGDSTTHPYLAINDDGSIYCIDKTVTEVEIPDYFNGIKVTSIDAWAFIGCSNLESIYISSEMFSISGMPWGAKNATIYWKREF